MNGSHRAKKEVRMSNITLMTRMTVCAAPLGTCI
jgi:hypothetical protein